MVYLYFMSFSPALSQNHFVLRVFVRCVRRRPGTCVFLRTWLSSIPKCSKSMSDEYSGNRLDFMYEIKVEYVMCWHIYDVEFSRCDSFQLSNKNKFSGVVWMSWYRTCTCSNIQKNMHTNVLMSRMRCWYQMYIWFAVVALKNINNKLLQSFRLTLKYSIYIYVSDLSHCRKDKYDCSSKYRIDDQSKEEKKIFSALTPGNTFNSMCCLYVCLPVARHTLPSR